MGGTGRSRGRTGAGRSAERRGRGSGRARLRVGRVLRHAERLGLLVQRRLPPVVGDLPPARRDPVGAAVGVGEGRPRPRLAGQRVVIGYPADTVVEIWRPNTGEWAMRGRLGTAAATVIDGETTPRCAKNGSPARDSERDGQ